MKEEKNRSGIFLIFIFGIFITFIYFLPRISSLINRTDNYKTIDKKINLRREYNTEDGLIKVGKESYIEIKDIIFYNFARVENSKIRYNVVSNKQISDVDNLSLYIETYNKGKELLSRNKFNHDYLDKSVIKTLYLELDKDEYLLTSYVKIIEEDEIDKSQKTLICRKNEEDLISKTKTITLNFIGQELKSYNVQIVYGSIEDATKIIENDYNELLNKSIKEINKQNNSIYYSVNLEKNQINNENLKVNITEYILYEKLTGEGYNCE